MRFWVGIRVLGGLAVACAGTQARAANPYLGKVYANGSWEDAQAISLPPSPTLPQLSSLPDLRSAALQFLSQNRSAFAADRFTAFHEVSSMAGGVFETHRFRKSWNGLEVVGGESLVQFHGGRFAFASGDATPLLGLSATPHLKPETARRIAFAAYRGRARSAGIPALKVLLVPRFQKREPHLAFAVKVDDTDLLTSEVQYIDAESGQELLAVSNVETIAERKILAAEGTASDFDAVTDADPARIEKDFTTVFDGGSLCPFPNPCRAVTAEIAASAGDAWTNSGLVLDYYLNTHRRSSVDGNGLPLRSVVNFAGTTFQNAAWFNDRRIMLFGMHAGKFSDFASALDVVAHEITHGVTASTAALQYAGESGALNESYSDIFGKLVAFRNGGAADWKIGETLFRDGSGNYLRDMENPVVGDVRDFKYRGEPCNRLNDYCGVHQNSGIPSKAAVKIAQSLGLDRFEKLYYLTLTQLLRPSSGFAEARAQTEAACATLYGAGDDCKAVREAFEAVGVK